MSTSLAAFTPVILAAADGIPNNVLLIILGGMLIGMLGVGIGFTAVVNEARIERSRHETIRVALEKGVPIPQELVSPRDRPKPPRDDRRTGIILVAVSAGVFIFLTMAASSKVAYVAAIPGCIGLGFLLNWAMEKRPRGLPPVHDPRG